MSCRHTAPMRGQDGRIDFSKRICTWGPPSMVAVPVGPGQIQIAPMYPPVTAGSIPCSQHDPRLVGEELAASSEGPKPQ